MKRIVCVGLERFARDGTCGGPLKRWALSIPGGDLSGKVYDYCNLRGPPMGDFCPLRGAARSSLVPRDLTAEFVFHCPRFALAFWLFEYALRRV